MWTVVYHPLAEQELAGIPAAPERAAIAHAVEKLATLGPVLPFPHQSHIEGPIRELRPLAGRSPWRAFYGRVGNTFVIASIGPEAEVKPSGFRRSVKAATTRLDEISE